MPYGENACTRVAGYVLTAKFSCTNQLNKAQRTISLHPDTEAFIQSAELAVDPRLQVDYARLISAARVVRLKNDAPPEEALARFAAHHLVVKAGTTASTHGAN